MNVGIIVQARMTSTRLPGKVLLKVANKEILAHCLSRLSVCEVPIFVATTTNTTDDCIVDLCDSLNIPAWRGSEYDVLSRYYECAKFNDLKVIVRVTSDCPLIDGNLLKAGLSEYLESYKQNLYVSNCLKRSYPRGMDFEIFSFELLEEAFHKANTDAQREHVTPYIHQNVSGDVQLLNIERGGDASRYRLTLDTQEDFELIKILIEEYNCHQKSVEEIIRVLDDHPELAKINAHIEQKKV